MRVGHSDHINFLNKQLLDYKQNPSSKGVFISSTAALLVKDEQLKPWLEILGFVESTFGNSMAMILSQDRVADVQNAVDDVIGCSSSNKFSIYCDPEHISSEAGDVGLTPSSGSGVGVQNKFFNPPASIISHRGVSIRNTGDGTMSAKKHNASVVACTPNSHVTMRSASSSMQHKHSGNMTLSHNRKGVGTTILSRTVENIFNSTGSSAKPRYGSTSTSKNSSHKRSHKNPSGSRHRYGIHDKQLKMEREMAKAALPEGRSGTAYVPNSCPLSPIDEASVRTPQNALITVNKDEDIDEEEMSRIEEAKTLECKAKDPEAHRRIRSASSVNGRSSSCSSSSVCNQLLSPTEELGAGFNRLQVHGSRSGSGPLSRCENYTPNLTATFNLMNDIGEMPSPIKKSSSASTANATHDALGVLENTAHLSSTVIPVARHDEYDSDVTLPTSDAEDAGPVDDGQVKRNGKVVPEPLKVPVSTTPLKRLSNHASPMSSNNSVVASSVACGNNLESAFVFPFTQRNDQDNEQTSNVQLDCLAKEEDDGNFPDLRTDPTRRSSSMGSFKMCGMRPTHSNDTDLMRGGSEDMNWLTSSRLSGGRVVSGEHDQDWSAAQPHAPNLEATLILKDFVESPDVNKAMGVAEYTVGVAMDSPRTRCDSNDRMVLGSTGVVQNYQCNSASVPTMCNSTLRSSASSQYLLHPDGASTAGVTPCRYAGTPGGNIIPGSGASKAFSTPKTDKNEYVRSTPSDAVWIERLKIKYGELYRARHPGAHMSSIPEEDSLILSQSPSQGDRSFRSLNANAQSEASGASRNLLAGRSKSVNAGNVNNFFLPEFDESRSCPKVKVERSTSVGSYKHVDATKHDANLRNVKGPSTFSGRSGSLHDFMNVVSDVYGPKSTSKSNPEYRSAWEDRGVGNSSLKLRPRAAGDHGSYISKRSKYGDENSFHSPLGNEESISSRTLHGRSSTLGGLPSSILKNDTPNSGSSGSIKRLGHDAVLRSRSVPNVPRCDDQHSPCMKRYFLNSSDDGHFSPLADGHGANISGHSSANTSAEMHQGHCDFSPSSQNTFSRAKSIEMFLNSVNSNRPSDMHNTGNDEISIDIPAAEKLGRRISETQGISELLQHVELGARDQVSSTSDHNNSMMSTVTEIDPENETVIVQDSQFHDLSMMEDRVEDGVKQKNNANKRLRQSQAKWKRISLSYHKKEASYLKHRVLSPRAHMSSPPKSPAIGLLSGLGNGVESNVLFHSPMIGTGVYTNALALTPGSTHKIYTSGGCKGLSSEKYMSKRKSRRSSMMSFRKSLYRGGVHRQSLLTSVQENENTIDEDGDLGRKEELGVGTNLDISCSIAPFANDKSRGGVVVDISTTQLDIIQPTTKTGMTHFQIPYCTVQLDAAPGAPARAEVLDVDEVTWKLPIIGGSYQHCVEGNVPVVAPPSNSETRVVDMYLYGNDANLALYLVLYDPIPYNTNTTTYKRYGSGVVIVGEARDHQTRTISLGVDWGWMRANPQGFIVCSKKPCNPTAKIEDSANHDDPVGYFGFYVSKHPTEYLNRSSVHRVVSRESPRSFEVRSGFNRTTPSPCSAMAMQLNALHVSDSDSPAHSSKSNASRYLQNISLVSSILEYVIDMNDPSVSKSKITRTVSRSPQNSAISMKQQILYCKSVCRSFAVATSRHVAMHVSRLSMNMDVCTGNVVAKSKKQNSMIMSNSMWISFLKRYPIGKFLSEGACKQVYKCESKQDGVQQTNDSGSESPAACFALSCMDIQLLKERGMEVGAIVSELQIALLCSSLLTDLQICPNFVRVHSMFQSSQPPPDALWNNSKSQTKCVIDNSMLVKGSTGSRQGAYQYMRMEFCCHGDLEDYVRQQGDNSYLSSDNIRATLFQMLYGMYTGREQLSLRHYDVKLLNFFATSIEDLVSHHSTTRKPLENSSTPSVSKDLGTVLVEYGFDQSIYSIPFERPAYSRGQSRGAGNVLVKLADFGTSSINISEIGDPIDENQLTTLENSPIEYLLQGSVARQSYAADTWCLGLCMFHMVSGMEPYEVLVEELVCPPYLLGKLKTIFEPSGRNNKCKSEGMMSPYQLIEDVIDSLEPNDDDGRSVQLVFYDTIYRFFVMFYDHSEYTQQYMHDMTRHAEEFGEPDDFSTMAANGGCAMFPLLCKYLGILNTELVDDMGTYNGSEPGGTRTTTNNPKTVTCNSGQNEAALATAIEFKANAPDTGKKSMNSRAGLLHQYVLDRHEWSLRFGSNNVMRRVRRRLLDLSGETSDGGVDNDRLHCNAAMDLLLSMLHFDPAMR